MNSNGITTVRVETSLAETIRDLLLQFIGIAAALVFGTWTVLSWQESKQANIQSTQANTFAFAAFCAQNSPGDNPQLSQLCDAVSVALQTSVSAVASSLFGSLTSTSPTPTTSFFTSATSSASATITVSAVPTVSPIPTTPPSSSPSGLSTGEIVGIVLALTSGLTAILAFLSCCVRRKSHDW